MPDNRPRITAAQFQCLYDIITGNGPGWSNKDVLASLVRKGFLTKDDEITPAGRARFVEIERRYQWKPIDDPRVDDPRDDWMQP